MISELFQHIFNVWPKNMDLDFVEHQNIFAVSFSIMGS